MKNLILAYEEAVENLASAFIEKYYGTEATEVWWVAEQVGGVLIINDGFWNLEDIVTALRLKIPKRVLFKWDSDSLDAAMKEETFMNLNTFFKVEKSKKKENKRKLKNP